MEFETKVALVLRDDLAVRQPIMVYAADADDLDLVGIGFRAERRTADRMLDRLRAHG
jgi:hypothetical protein